MLPFVLAMQVGGAPAVPPPAPVTAPMIGPGASAPYAAPPLAPTSSSPGLQPAPGPPAPPAVAGSAGAYPAPPPGYETGPQPYPYGYGTPPSQPYPYGYGPPGYAPPPPPPPARGPATWLVRAQIALGPPGFSEQTGLLRLEGYGGAKFWAEIDGGYFPRFASGNVGFGLWAALSYWTSSSGDGAPRLEELSYFVGPELPLRFGPRELAFFFAPRVGVAVGSQSFGGDAPTQTGFAWGGQLGAVSSVAHLTFGINLLRAVIGPPGEVGRPHDLGGFYFSIGGLFDDG
jgi:hypothetical protein